MTKLSKIMFYEELCGMFPQLTSLQQGINTTVDINDSCALYTMHTSLSKFAAVTNIMRKLGRLVGVNYQNHIAVHFVDVAHEIEYVLSINVDSKSADVAYKYGTNFDQYCFPWTDLESEERRSILTNRDECLAYLRSNVSSPSYAPTP